MTSLPTLEAIMNHEDYYKIATNFFKRFIWVNFKDLDLFEVIKIEFWPLIIENKKSINAVT